MKLQAVLIAVALVAGGSAFAATDSTPASDSTAKPAAAAPHKAKSSTKHKTTHHTKTSSKSKQHAKSSTQHMGASAGHHESMSMATPSTDLSARDRQNRIDEAYDKWKSSHS